MYVESWRSTCTVIIPNDVLAKLSHEERRPMWHGAISGHDKSAVCIGRCNSQRRKELVGIAVAGPERTSEYPYEGKLNAVYLFQDYQGMVIGRDLVMATVQDLLAAAMSSLTAWVLDEKPACSFYASLEDSREFERNINIGRAVLKEIGFGWRNLKGLSA